MGTGSGHKDTPYELVEPVDVAHKRLEDVTTLVLGQLPLQLVDDVVRRPKFLYRHERDEVLQPLEVRPRAHQQRHEPYLPFRENDPSFSCRSSRRPHGDPVLFLSVVGSGEIPCEDLSSFYLMTFFLSRTLGDRGFDGTVPKAFAIDRPLFPTKSSEDSPNPYSDGTLSRGTRERSDGVRVGPSTPRPGDCRGRVFKKVERLLVHTSKLATNKKHQMLIRTVQKEFLRVKLYGEKG